MPGPFPGMDPYLESPTHWRGLHELLIALMTVDLNALLPPGFVANIDERVYLVQPERALYPDVAILQRPDVSPPFARAVSGGGTATVVLEDPPALLTVFPDEMRESFIEVRRVDDERVVTIIEVLSPANKAPGSEGRDPYVRKQEQLLRSETHLLEIDLLRQGTHTAAAPLNGLRDLGRWDYLVCLHRGNQRWQYEVWQILVRQRLPRVRVPLVGDHPDVILDLQAAFDRVYDGGPYRRRVDYRQEPDPPLAPDDAAWADALLCEKSLRSAS